MSSVVGRRCPSLREVAQSRVSELLDATAPGLEGPVSLLIDGRYPYHPSTGLVTNPIVVEAVIEALKIRDIDVSLWCPSGGQFTAEQCVSYLGYDELLDRTGVELADAEDGSTVERTVRVENETITLSLADSLVSGTVVAMPTLKRLPPAPPATGMELTARASLGHEPSTDEVSSAAIICKPTLTILDGTYAFSNRPSSPEILLASSDVMTLDRAVAWLTGVSSADVPYLETWGLEDGTPPVEGVEIDAIRESLQTSENDALTQPPSRMAEYGYRLYSRVSDDLVPPQFLPGSGQ